MSNPTPRTDCAIIVEARQVESSPVFAASIQMVETAAKTLGMEVHYGTRDIINQKVRLDSEDQLAGRPVFVYGSLQFVRDLRGPYYAWGFKNTDWLTMSANVSRDILLNHDYVMTTWGDLKANYLHWASRVDPVGMFIRPSSDKKTFAGDYVSVYGASDKLKAIEETTSVIDTTLCVMSSFKDILDEFRYFIVDRKVISSTYYHNFTGMPGRAAYVYKTAPDKANQLAEYVANMAWQPDDCYVVDIAMDGNSDAKIIEFNSLCCSGVYNANVAGVLDAVRRHTFRDYFS